jgi:hypothetical protein
MDKFFQNDKNYNLKNKGLSLEIIFNFILFGYINKAFFRIKKFTVIFLSIIFLSGMNYLKILEQYI